MSYMYSSLCDAVIRGVRPATGGDRFWRIEDPVVEETDPEHKRVVVGGMWPSHRRWWESQKMIKVLVGGMGSGKTRSLVKRGISLALENAPAPVACISPSYAMAMKTVQPTFVALLEMKRAMYGKAFHWRYVQNPIPTFHVRFRGRPATIWLLSSDNPMSLRGPNLAALLIDEPFMQPRQVYDEAVGRVREPTAVRREILLAGTPESLNNWGYDLCTGALGNPDDVEVVHVSTLENKVLPKSFIDNMKATFTAKALDAYLHGIFRDMTEGQTYYAFEHREHAVSLPLPSSVELGLGLDFNVNPMTGVVFWHAGDRFHVIDVIELENSGTEEMCREVRKRYPTLSQVYPDASGAARKTSSSETDFTILKKWGFELNVLPSNPAVRDRENTVNGKLRAANERVSVTIDPQCKKLLKALALYKRGTTAEQKKMSHVIDAFGYPICQLYPLASYEARHMRY